MTTPRQFIDRNLMTIIAAGLALYGGYITGQVTTGAKIASLERDVAELRGEKGAIAQRLLILECTTNTGECKR